MTKCLVVDDVIVSRFAARTFLEDLKITVVEAGDESGAIKQLSDGGVDVVLLDWHLKKESGLDILKIIREKYGNSIKVILFSGVEDGSKLSEAKEHGADAYMAKPTTKEKIVDEFKSLGLL